MADDVEPADTKVVPSARVDLELVEAPAVADEAPPLPDTAEVAAAVAASTRAGLSKGNKSSPLLLPLPPCSPSEVLVIFASVTLAGLRSGLDCVSLPELFERG